VEPVVLTIVAVVLAIVCTVCLVPVLLFRPLVMAISKRISGNKVESEEVRQLKARLALLECQVNDMHSRMGSIEDSSHFTHKVLEDVVRKTNPEGFEQKIDVSKNS
jgi:hypothetical protein